MKRQVALDAGILIWARRRPADAQQRQWTRQCSLVLAQLDEEEAQVILPAPALAEFLVGVNDADRGRVTAELSKTYEIAPFDAKAAALAADLFVRHRGLPKAEQIERVALKVDVMVVAIAKVAGARQLFTRDERLRRLAEATRLSAPSLPTHDENMFLDRDADRDKPTPPSERS